MLSIAAASGDVLGRYPFAPEWESSTRTHRLISFACRVPFTDDIAYSSDGGATWGAQSVEQTKTSFDVTLALGISHRIRIAASDGVRSAQAEIAFST